jgi:transposase InsO family protein
MKQADKQNIIDNHPEVKFRLKILGFLEKYDLKTTIDAYEVSKSIIYRWRSSFRARGEIGLINQSRRPYNTRRMMVDTKVFDFIKNIREERPRIGKDKIKILLDNFCQEKGLVSISESKVGRLIKKNNWFFYLGNRHDGKQGDRNVKRDKKRVFGYEVTSPGDLFQVDTIVRFEYGVKRYLVTAIDVVSRFAFSYTYKNHSSRSAADFMEKLIRVTPYGIKAIQTDNGSEFLKDFDKIMAKNGIVHFFTYPRCPKQNGTIERFNRTLQEEFVEQNRSFLGDSDAKDFNNLLIDYLLFYNTQRPHHSLKNQVPMKQVTDYLLKSNMWWPDTLTSFLYIN